MSIIDKALELIKGLEFVELATADQTGKPNSAPKFFLKTNGRTIYLIDYSIGKTADNLKVNSKVSLSFIDFKSLFGYKLNGKAQIIKTGKIYDKCLKELEEKEVKLSAKRIIKEVQENKPSCEAYELQLPARVLVYKIRVEEGSGISPSGVIQRENNEEAQAAKV